MSRVVITPMRRWVTTPMSMLLHALCLCLQGFTQDIITTTEKMDTETVVKMVTEVPGEAQGEVGYLNCQSNH